MNHLNTIEVSLRDYQRAFDIVEDLNVNYTQPSQTEFSLESDDEWNDVMLSFESNEIEIY